MEGLCHAGFIDDLRLLITMVRRMPYKAVSGKRKELFRLINGDAFFPTRRWPKEMQKIFWMKPISRKNTFKLFLFLVGNGRSPHLAAQWIMYAQFWDSEDLRKRYYHLSSMMKKFYHCSDRWFYFDIETNSNCLLSGLACKFHRKPKYRWNARYR